MLEAAFVEGVVRRTTRSDGAFAKVFPPTTSLRALREAPLRSNRSVPRGRG